MGILGKKKLRKRQRRVLIGQDEDGAPVYVIMTAFAMKTVEGIQAQLPEPVAPLWKDAQGRGQVERDAKGRVMKDDLGSPIPRRNREDPEFKKAESKRERAFNAAMILACDDGGQLTPTTKRESFENDLIGYYAAVFTELTEALDAAAVAALVQAAVSFTEPLTAEEIEEARCDLGLDEETQAQLKAELGSKAPEGKSGPGSTG